MQIDEGYSNRHKWDMCYLEAIHREWFAIDASVDWISKFGRRVGMVVDCGDADYIVKRYGTALMITYWCKENISTIVVPMRTFCDEMYNIAALRSDYKMGKISKFLTAFVRHVFFHELGHAVYDVQHTKSRFNIMSEFTHMDAIERCVGKNIDWFWRKLERNVRSMKK